MGYTEFTVAKVTAPDCTYTTKIDFREAYEGDRGGLVMMGKDYALVGVEFRDGKLTLVQADCVQADKGKPEQVNATVPFTGGPVWLRCRIAWKMDDKNVPQMHGQFSYSLNGKKFTDIGRPFVGREGSGSVPRSATSQRPKSRRMTAAGWISTGSM